MPVTLIPLVRQLKWHCGEVCFLLTLKFARGLIFIPPSTSFLWTACNCFIALHTNLYLWLFAINKFLLAAFYIHFTLLFSVDTFSYISVSVSLRNIYYKFYLCVESILASRNTVASSSLMCHMEMYCFPVSLDLYLPVWFHDIFVQLAVLLELARDHKCMCWRWHQGAMTQGTAFRAGWKLLYCAGRINAVHSCS